MSRYPLILLICAVNAFSAAVVTSGTVAPIRTLTVSPLGISAEAGAEPTAVADIRIDNNLPEYELILEFAEEGNDGRIAEVSLQGMDGILGRGCEAPARTVLAQGALPGQYIWRPGSQRTATVGYQVRVMVAWQTPPSRPPRLAVAMPSSY